MLIYSPAMTRPDPSFSIPAAAPVFPLPNAVLFPHTILPLHVFEPRYRTMVAEASRGEGCIAVSLLRPGWEKDYEGSPAYHEIGCVGRMTDVALTGDGRYYLKLVGLRKVALGEPIRSSPYRTAPIRAIEEMPPGDHSPSNREDLVRLLGACAVLVQEISEKPFPMVTLNEGLPYETVVNSVCAHVGLPPEVKQSLLEIDDLRERCLKLTAFLEAHLQKLLLSREKAARGGDPGLVN
jgi:uncharacterized protein